MSEPSAPERHWISLDDPVEQRTWLFDVSFLESRWGCLYGCGCHGIAEQPDAAAQIGCCSHGAFFSDDEDRQRVAKVLDELDPTLWQLADEAHHLGGAIYQDTDGHWRTRVLEEACILLNRPDHVGGPGCVLHQHAVEHSIAPMDVKPEVCWQVPLRREDHETETGHLFTMVREWTRSDWGGGGPEFGWWCTDAPEAYDHASAAYLTLEAELTAICGEDIYSALRELLDERANAGRASEHPVEIRIRESRP